MARERRVAGRFGAMAVVIGALVAAPPALAACQITRYAEIPVTMARRSPIVTAQINGRDARFILDSGAFYSTIAEANARDYGLSIQSLGGARLKGIGGETTLESTTAKEFRIAGQTLPHVVFAVGGSDTGYAGLLGQNILGLADVEYDLPHGIVRLLKGKDCRTAGLAYWAGTRPVTLVPLEPMDSRQRHTIGTVLINGVKIKAAFDTGAQGSMLTLAAAKRLGFTPDGADVQQAGFSYGVGQGRVRTWRARFASIDIGGEAIPRPSFAVADQVLDDADMLIGIDFFLTHHLYVDNTNHRMFITYEGGPVFGLTPTRAVDDAGAPLDLADKAAEPTDAAGYSRRGAVLASGRKFDQALVDLDKAVAMAPGDGQYLLQRAAVHLANRQPLLGAADLDKAIALAPDLAEARLARAQLRLSARDPAGALEDLTVAERTLAPSADAQLRLAGMFGATDAYEREIAAYDRWLKTHPEDHGRPTAFNGRCWARALLNRDLDKALSDCDTAVRMRPGEAAYLDSRALVRLRRGELDKAIADYDAAVKVQPRNAWSLYARGVAERRAGRTSAADTDQAAAVAINPAIADRARRYGL